MHFLYEVLSKEFHLPSIYKYMIMFYKVRSFFKNVKRELTNAGT